MRRLFAMVLVSVACAWLFSPDLGAGGQQSTARFAQQWRILPHAPFRRPADAEVMARLTRQIDPLINLLEAGADEGGDGVGDAWIAGKARNQLFRLESLLRLYVRQFPDFERTRREVKAIEDGLGDYSYAVDSMNFAKDRFKKENEGHAPDAARKAEQDQILAGLARKQEKARVSFAKLVERSPLASDLPQFKTELASSLAGWDSSQDLGYVNHELQRVLKDVRDGRYNFNLLEDGIHEFRRRLRWFPMYIDALDGLVVLRDDPPGKCPVPSLESLAGSRAAKHKYSNPALSAPAAHPCAISRCLIWQVAKTVDDIGRLKDTAQGNIAVEAALDADDVDVSGSNKATRDEIERATGMRSELFKTRTLDILLDQLSSCKS